MAPRPARSRRPGPAVVRLGRLVVVHRAAVAIAWAMTGIWWIAPIASQAGPRWQPLAWIPDWAWLLGVLVPTAIGMVLSIGLPRRRLLGAAIVAAALVPPGLGTLVRDVGWTDMPPAPTCRVAFLNAQSPAAAEAETELDAILALEADLVIVVNPGWIPSTWRSRAAVTGDGPWSIQWREPVMVASTHGPTVLRTLHARDGVRAVRLDPPEAVGLGPLLVVDLPSDPALDRDAITTTLLEGLSGSGVEGLADFDLVLGDFNMTPRTPALARLRGDLVDLVSAAGDGWTATWPRRRPLLRIDQVFSGRARPACVRTFDPGAGGHRGLLVDLGPVAD